MLTYPECYPLHIALVHVEEALVVRQGRVDQQPCSNPQTITSTLTLCRVVSTLAVPRRQALEGLIV